MKIQIGYPLSVLPNIHGFQFRGVTHDGDLIHCIVSCDKNGFHFIEDEFGNPAFHILRGWMQYLPQKVVA